MADRIYIIFKRSHYLLCVNLVKEVPLSARNWQTYIHAIYILKGLMLIPLKPLCINIMIISIYFDTCFVCENG